MCLLPAYWVVHCCCRLHSISAKVVLPVSNDTSLTLEKNELFSDIPPPNWVARYDCTLMMRL